MKNFFEKFERLINNQFAALILLFILFFAYRLALLAQDVFPFNSDEAIVGIMAKHILHGERPLFFYGQSYMGSLDAYLVALSFRIFGEKVLAIRILQLALFFLTLVNIYFYVIIAFQNRKAAFLSSVLLIFSPVNLILYTTVSLGGYGEALWVGSFVLLVSALIYQEAKKTITSQNKLFFLFFAASLMTGLGFWVNPISLTITVPALLGALFPILKGKRKAIFYTAVFFLLLIGFVAGSFFWWHSFFLNKDVRFLSEFFGSAVSVEQGSYIQIVIQHLLSFLLFAPTVILGMRAPWSTSIIGVYFVPFVLFFWILTLAVYFSRRKTLPAQERIQYLCLLGSMGLVFVGYVFTSFGTDPSGRYFLPFYIPLAVIAGTSIIRFPRIKLILALLLAVLCYNIFGTLSSAAKFPYLTTQFYEPAQVDHSSMGELISFLSDQGETVGYSNYWVAYPLAFYTDERIIALPFLPYHPDLTYTDRDNRLPRYIQRFGGKEMYFYITTKNPNLDDVLKTSLSAMDVEFDYIEIDDYHVFYNLSQPISPEALGLYEHYK